MTNRSIAAILTCHNRKAKTLACLDSLFRYLPDAVVFLTDDGCTDGTPEEVARLYPTSVHIVRGNGHLFWSRGMYLAWREAMAEDFDFYLWLNDDVVMYPSFFEELMGCYELMEPCIVSGLIENKEHTAVLYGGSNENGQLITEADTPQMIRNLNGNVVLVPRLVVQKIGIIDPVLHHDLGDVDYGLTAQECGIRVVSTRKAVAYGYPNGICRIRKWNSTLTGRFKKLNTPLGSPIKLNYYFRKKHYGTVHAVLYCGKVILLNILPDCCVTRIWGNAYKDKVVTER